MRMPPALVRLLETRPALVIHRVLKGTWRDGFVSAGNLAYLSLLTLFPFFIVVATVAGVLGRTDDGIHIVRAFLRTVPPDVGKLIAEPIKNVIAARSGKGLLTFGVLVTLWTVSGFIETVRDIIRRAYGTVGSHAAWQYRLGAFVLIISAVMLMLVAFTVQIMLTGAEQFIIQLLPVRSDALTALGFGKIGPALASLAALWLIFYALTPKKYRGEGCRLWPGTLLTTFVWLGTTMLLPMVLGMFGGYDLTYGSLAGVIVALLFFYITGIGLVLGAQLNAALAIVPKTGQYAPATATEPVEQGS